MLEDWAAQGVISLHTAFSREGPKKVYVQDLLRDSGDQVWQLLQAGGHFYVCGDANSMAGAVEQTLLQVIEEGLGASTQEAQKYLDDMAAEGRYERDVWFS
jgi:sulfite reductase alpha subunit-like flavoprotein